MFENIFLVLSTDAYSSADVMDCSKEISCQTPRDCRNRVTITGTTKYIVKLTNETPQFLFGTPRIQN